MAALQRAMAALHRAMAALQRAMAALQRAMAALQRAMAALQRAMAVSNVTKELWLRSKELRKFLKIMKFEVLSVPGDFRTRHNVRNDVRHVFVSREFFL